jgi:hypothetical protein
MELEKVYNIYKTQESYNYKNMPAGGNENHGSG